MVMKFLLIKFVSWVLLACFPLSVAIAQDDLEGGSSDFGGDPFEGVVDESIDQGLQWDVQESESEPLLEETPESSTQASEPVPHTPEAATAPEPTNFESAVEYTPLGSVESEGTQSNVQNAIIEGIQLSSEDTDVPGEKIISGYFIFRDKPSSYFYEVKLREKKIVFEFNDTRTGSSPVPSASELPIKGFKIVQDKVDVNKEVKGLKPEWHDLIRVTFDMEAIPQIHVNDEYSVISFSFKWSTDPAKVAQYIVKDNTPKIILWSSAGVGGLGLGTLAYFLLRKEPGPEKLGPLSKEDLPLHEKGN
jgi:hypothetical protein